MRPDVRAPVQGIPGRARHAALVRAQPTADLFLTEFFDDRRRGATGIRRHRIDRMEADLRLAVELCGPEVMGEDDLVLLAAERQFGPIAAVGRVLGTVQLPEVLDRYLADPLYRPFAADEVRDRLDTCAALIRRLARQPELAKATRQLRRLDERVRLETATLRPLRRVASRRRAVRE